MTTLELVPTKANTVAMSVTAGLTHLCPFKDEVDDGQVTITWRVDGRTLELHSLRAWLDAMDESVVSHEDLTQAIAEALLDLGLRGVSVVSQWTTAGMSVEVQA